MPAALPPIQRSLPCPPARPRLLQPPLAEATSARDAAVAALLASLGAAGLAAPAAAGPADVRGAVARAVREAQQLPAMPPYVDYSALLASLQQWAEALQGARADVDAARREAAQATSDTGAQLAAAAADDKEALWRLGWLRCVRTGPGNVRVWSDLARKASSSCRLAAAAPCLLHATAPPPLPRPCHHCRSEQQPLVEARLGDVAGQVAPPATTAAAALGEVRQQIEEQHVPALVKPPLAELEARRDAAVEQLAAGLGWVGLVSAHGSTIPCTWRCCQSACCLGAWQGLNARLLLPRPGAAAGADVRRGACGGAAGD